MKLINVDDISGMDYDSILDKIDEFGYKMESFQDFDIDAGVRRTCIKILKGGEYAYATVNDVDYGKSVVLRVLRELNKLLIKKNVVVDSRPTADIAYAHPFQDRLIPIEWIESYASRYDDERQRYYKWLIDAYRSELEEKKRKLGSNEN